MPLGPGHVRVPERLVGQAVPLGDPLEVAADLVTGGVAVSRDVAELLEHGDVDVRLDVAHDAGVAVPIPGPADPSGLIDDADPLHPPLSKLHSDQHARNPSAEDDDVHFVADRRTLDEGRKWVVPESPEDVVVIQVPDVGPALDQPLVPLGQVFGGDGLGVEGCRGCVRP